MNRTIAILFTIVLVFGSLLVISQENDTLLDEGNIKNQSNLTSRFAGGDGSSGDPYLISNVSHLQDMFNDLDAHYEIINDIDASNTSQWNNSKGFKPVGYDLNS